MSDLVTMQGWLADAEAAKHKLLTGSLRQRVSYNGQEVTFAATDIDKLTAYIGSLRAQIGALGGDRTKVSRPIYFGF